MSEETESIRDHPDFKRIQGIITRNLESISELGKDEVEDHYEKSLDGDVDLSALVMASVVRARTVGGENHALGNSLSGMWLEGFLTGLIYNRPATNKARAEMATPSPQEDEDDSAC